MYFLKAIISWINFRCTFTANSSKSVPVRVLFATSEAARIALGVSNSEKLDIDAVSCLVWRGFGGEKLTDRFPLRFLKNDIVEASFADPRRL
jgi:xanthine dehydrogenase molybdopterin-binding subunit B